MSLISLLVLGCGASSPTNSVNAAKPATANISVAISPHSTAIVPGQSLQFSAAITGTSDKRLTWTVNGFAGGTSSIGTITFAGLYFAPTAVPSGGSVTVGVRSNADPSATDAVTLLIANRVSIDPPVATVAIAGTLQFQASVNGNWGADVRWTVNGIENGNPTIGTINAVGTYTAPQTNPGIPIIVTATDFEDHSVFANSSVTIFDPVLVKSHDEWLEGVADVAASYGCTDISVQQQPNESITEALFRFASTADEESCLVLAPVSTDSSSLRYSLAWGGSAGGKDILYISDVGQMRIWNGAVVN